MRKVKGFSMSKTFSYGGAVLAILVSQSAVTLLFSQLQVAQIDLSPPDAADSDTITFKLNGTWPNGCVPQSPVVSVSAGSVRIDTTNPGMVCTQALTPWSMAGVIGKLSPGQYDVIVRFSGPGLSSPAELGRRTLSVADSSSITEMILPIVVNGAVAEKLHYQTIFTVLNTTAADVKGTLQVFSNAGAASGAFCSPLAPAPSGATFTLNPNSQYFQFTSADLAFLNGWARVRWQGSSPIVVSQELTLVAAPPAPCLLVCNRPSTEKLSSAQITAVKPAREFRMPMTINPNRQTAVALINPSSAAPVTVKVAILDSAGQSAQLNVPSSFEITIRPLERVSKFVWEMAIEQSSLASRPTPPSSFQGSLIFSSDSLFVASGLQIMFPEGKFTPVPAVATR
jgi:hypothetical protein